MNLFDIVQRNIRRNFKEYILYFVSLASSMLIYFIFASLRYSTQIKKEMVNNVMINSVLQSSKVILIIFIAIFIIYSTNFFIRKRKKEVGLYSLLGITKKQIGTMLFCETMIMGGFALVVGILIGSMSFKLFLELLMSLMKLNVPIHFELSIKAIIDTFIVFLSILLYTAWKNSRIIYKFPLIEMFQANHQGERMPKGSVLRAYIGLILMGLGYILAGFFREVVNIVRNPIDPMNPIINPIMIPVFILFLVVFGTYFLFTSYTVIVLKKIRSKREIFYSGINIINISQLLYRVKGNAKLLATIAILSATALTAISTVAAGYYVGQSETNGDFMQLYGVALFIGSFLGGIFVLATGSIIYYKQLSEAYANQRYYETLRKIGVTKKEVRKSISKQVSFSFISPLIVGLVHSLFAIPIINNIPINNIIIPILISSGAYCIIYFGYYVLTVYSYFKVVYK
ncbi:ABC transporter permease [Bacillus sp. FSL L8-0199]|uniref:ABC transporter permease n=1 Tax=Bacillus cereus TaxID=1396 RepID=A0A9X7GUH3_BACCE|nr:MULTISPECIES: ABC transporter permease [Bacillus cereus group]EKS7855409.1 ABC transporter permease [Bacillus cereus]MBD8077059.1 ABC transporter permease [Bacillus thuringiensis]MCC2382777.1 ABC transporter permease [Bacillus cereus]MCH5475122.1 ABC transporter permease [Bacillus cereus]MEC0038192.1 ABC transporter permease [Bacillus cereus]